MSMTDGEYNEYLSVVRNIISSGTKEQLITYYKMMIAATGDLDNVLRMDKLNNDRWNIEIRELL